MKVRLSGKNEEEQFFQIDEESFSLVNKHKWYLCKDGYIATSIKNKKGKWKISRLHQFLLSNPSGTVDHIDGDKKNNQLSNLRRCSQQFNCFNQRKMKGASSKYKGVSYVKRLKKWVAEITLNQKRYRLGLHLNEEDAALAYNRKAEELFGKFARLNPL
jgi:hypothetical protein